MGKILLAALWIVTPYLTVVVTVTAVILIGPVEMRGDEPAILVGFLGAGNLALIIVALCALVGGHAQTDEPKSK